MILKVVLLLSSRWGYLSSDIEYGDIDYEDERKAVSLSLTKRFKNRDELTIGGDYSSEYDYDSKRYLPSISTI